MGYNKIEFQMSTRFCNESSEVLYNDSVYDNTVVIFDWIFYLTMQFIFIF